MKFAAAILAYAFISANAEDLVPSIHTTLTTAKPKTIYFLLTQMTDEIKKEFVDAHNKYRSLVENPFPKEMPALVWDDYVAFKAQDWANGCLQDHSPHSYRQYDVKTTTTTNKQTSLFCFYHNNVPPFFKGHRVLWR